MRVPSTATEKRSSLVQAAAKLLHQQGYERTSLAHVATEARVPLGNVYYYFKTKDALAEAVIAAHEAGLRAQFASWEAAHTDIRGQLRCLIRAPMDTADSVIQFGCPHGSLCQELEKLGAKTSLARSGARLLSVYIDWAEEQFSAHGLARREANALAAELVAAVQGTMLVAHTLRSRELLQRQLHRLEHWLDESLSITQEHAMTDTGAHSLSDSISDFTAEMAKRAPPQVLATLSAEIKKLADSGIAKHALAVGAKAPDFTLPDTRGGKLSLSTLLTKGPVVLTFYRYGSCPFCNLQLRAYQSVLPRIHDLGAELVAISAQKPDLAAADMEEKALTFPVLTDAHNQVSRQYGLVFKLSEVFQQLQTGFGSPIPKFTGDDSWELLMPGTFVLDRQRVVRLAHVDPDYRVRLEPAAILDSLQGLQG